MNRMRVLVKKVRPFNFATVALLNSRGVVVLTEKTLSVKFPERYEGSFEEGSVWEVSGQSRERSYRIGDQTFTEDLVTAQQVVRICPEGPVIAFWIERNVPGIGQIMAKKLTRAIKDLNQIIRQGDIDTLCAIDGVSATKAHELISRWPDENIYSAMRFLADCGLPAKLAEPITKIYKTRTEDLIKADPYLLTSLGVPFDDVEALVKRLELEVSEADRSVALVEEAAHRKSMTGSTVVLNSDIKKLASDMGYSISARASAEAVNRGALVQVEGGYQTIGMARMEAVVGHRINSFACRKAGDDALSARWESDIAEESVTEKLKEYEQRDLGFELTNEQRQAVVGALISPVCCISGGAGVGKTTILRAILGTYRGFDTQGMKVHLMALSGRAARRISQSTGYPAQTIAKYVHNSLRNTASQNRGQDDHSLIVIDEASMVDLHTMYKLVNVLPNATRILFVGDTAQLPPVGPGLIFHELVKTGIPTFNLQVVKRQTAESGILKFATAVREGEKPRLPKLETCLSESPDFCHSNDFDLDLIRSLWEEAGRSEKCIVLAPTNSGEFGVDTINAYIQEHIGTDRPKLSHLDIDSGLIPWRTKGRHLHLGDQVMVTANDYQNNIRNGDLATITEVYSRPTENREYGVMELEGDLIPINDDVIEKLDLGFCITIHKSQGSQWPVAIMLLSPEGENMTDRSLLYTGATRPQERLIILGRETSIVSAIERGNFSENRKVALKEILTKPGSAVVAC
jgi:exodeoxyribonuclease V alpha subunit